MTEFLSQILSAAGLVPDALAKKKHGNSPEITNKHFILAILETNSIVELAAKLNIGEQTANRIVTKVLVPLFGKRTGGGNSWKLALLNNAELKKCSKCKKILAHSAFTKDQDTFDKLDKNCRQCKSVINTDFYENNKNRYHKIYIEEHRGEYNARNATYRAAKSLATPLWADKNKITEIYTNCPKGFHVDHIYPLNSTWVCGLHVENNLQYLTAQQNMSKGNRKF